VTGILLQIPCESDNESRPTFARVMPETEVAFFDSHCIIAKVAFFLAVFRVSISHSHVIRLHFSQDPYHRQITAGDNTGTSVQITQPRLKNRVEMSSTHSHSSISLYYSPDAITAATRVKCWLVASCDSPAAIYCDNVPLC